MLSENSHSGIQINEIGLNLEENSEQNANQSANLQWNSQMMTES